MLQTHKGSPSETKAFEHSQMSAGQQFSLYNHLTAITVVRSSNLSGQS